MPSVERHLRGLGPSRIAGRPALVRRTQRLALAVQRFGHRRASSEADRRWAAHLMSHLVAGLHEAKDGDR